MRWYGALAAALSTVVSLTAPRGGLAQQSCDDFNECTTGSMCMPEGFCGQGVPVADGTPCGQEVTIPCMTNPTCLDGSCSGGTFAPPGTPCKIFDSPCVTTGTCTQFDPDIPFTGCTGSMFMQCPQDANLCTYEFCNTSTGQCDSTSGCFISPEAPAFECSDATCNPANGQCTFTPKNEGRLCNDFVAFECMPASRCHLGDCVSGEPTEPTPTPTAVVATPTPGAGCVGDCNDDGEVTIDDLILMVSIAQEVQPISACPNGNPNGDEEITIDEILQAVTAALSGC